jgi:hypothetical protein
MNFLQEDNVCTGFGDALTHGFQHKTAIASAIALVDVVGQNVYILAHENPGNKYSESACTGYSFIFRD